LTELDELDTIDQPTPMGLEEKVIRKENAMNVHVYLHDLTEPYKEVFMLRVFGELSFRQIGDLFSKTENWACVTFYRAKKKIIEQLEGSTHEE
jgi:RNA polymerase sigma-70 factor (ECF subfamily)